MTYEPPRRPGLKQSAALKTLVVFVCVFLLGVLLMLVGFFAAIAIGYTVGGLLILVGFVGTIISAIVLLVRWSTSTSSISQPGAGYVGAAPGWYPDPQNSGLLRHFDGQAWTESTRPR